MKIMFGISLIAILQMFGSCNMAEPETYLIPSNYVGNVQIVFNQNGIPIKYKNEFGRDTIFSPKIGKPIKYENGRRIYEIPDGGILLTQFKANDGWTDRKYYSVDSMGTKTLLEIFKFEHFKKDSAGYVVNDKNKVGIFGDGTNVSYGNMNIPALDFTVCNYIQLNSFSTEEYLKRFTEKIEKVIGY